MKKGKNMLGRKALTIASIFILFSGCDEVSDSQNSENQELETIEAILDEVDTKRAVMVESIIRSSPNLAETGEVFAEIGSDFTRDYLNDIDNVNSYTTLSSQGINLGVYLADLGYITTFEQSQEVIFYMKSAQKLAEGIGVSNVFDEKTVERMEMNINDKDSIIELISELYWKTDSFLKELNRENISALIICGGWIEGMHIGSSMIADGFVEDVVYEKLAKQRNNLKKILSLLNTFEGDENIEMFEERLKEIDADYGDFTYTDGQSFTEEQKEQLNTVAIKIDVLRNEIIQP